MKYSELREKPKPEVRVIEKPAPPLEGEIDIRLPIDGVGFFVRIKHRIYKYLIKRWIRGD